MSEPEPEYYLPGEQPEKRMTVTIENGQWVITGPGLEMVYQTWKLREAVEWIEFHMDRWDD